MIRKLPNHRQFPTAADLAGPGPLCLCYTGENPSRSRRFSMKDSLGARAGEPAGTGTPDIKQPAAPAIDTDTTASEVAMSELRRLLAAWRVHEPGARLGHHPEALHQLRVTARRIDATL